MLRITTLPKNSSVVELKLEGEIAAEWISLLEGQCDKLTQEGKAIRLDFREVRFIDRRGVEMLKQFDRHGLKVVRCPDAIQDFINQCKSPDQASDLGQSDDTTAGEA